MKTVASPVNAGRPAAFLHADETIRRRRRGHEARAQAWIAPIINLTCIVLVGG